VVVDRRSGSDQEAIPSAYFCDDPPIQITSISCEDQTLGLKLRATIKMLSRMNERYAMNNGYPDVHQTQSR
jgi:hypothetical protein